MPTPNYSDVADIPLTTDEQLLERVQSLLTAGYRRQLWLLFLDSDGCQLPLLMPCDVPSRPTSHQSSDLAGFVAGLADEVRASTVVIVYERRGNDTVSDADRQWFRLVHDACARAELPLRGPLLCHSSGVRWVAAEDYLLE